MQIDKAKRAVCMHTNKLLVYPVCVTQDTDKKYYKTCKDKKRNTIKFVHLAANV